MTKPPSDSGKPRALFLSPEAPFPAIGGGPLRSASVLEYLAQRFSVHAILFREPGAPHPAAAIRPGLADRIDVLDLAYHSKHPVARALRNSVRMARNVPPLIDRFSGFAAEIAALASGEKYDAAVIEHFWCAPYIQQVRPHAKRLVLDLHNIDSVWFRTQAALEKWPRAIALRRFAQASVELEREWLPQFDVLLAASELDAARLRETDSRLNLIVYPNALPEVSLPARASLQEIVFSGNLEYPPNLTAVRLFHDRIWPVLRQRWPNLRWKLVGKNSGAVADLLRHDDRIELTGFVHDAVALLAASQVAVVPVVTGSGTRVKILEAWAAATPVVSTTLGAEGLNCRDGEHLLIANEPSRFADAVSQLLASADDRARIGAAGRRLYEERYTWPMVWRNLEAAFRN